MYFSVCFGGSIVTISLDKSTHSHLDISASLGLPQYQSHTDSEALFLWKDSYDKLSASRSLGRLSYIGMLVNNFMLDQTASSSAMYFSVSFWWIYSYKMGKRLDNNACSYPSYIVTIDPPKNTQKTLQTTKRSGPTYSC